MRGGHDRVPPGGWSPRRILQRRPLPRHRCQPASPDHLGETFGPADEQSTSRPHRVHLVDGGQGPASRLSIYAATKYGLRGFAACLRQELHDAGVGVSVVSPGSVSDVGMFAESGARTNVGTVTSAEVAAGVIRAIEHNKHQVDVAPRTVRLAG